MHWERVTQEECSGTCRFDLKSSIFEFDSFSILLEFFDFEMFERWEANKFNIVLLSLDERFNLML